MGFKTNINKVMVGLLGKFKDLQFFTGESMDAEAMILMLDYREVDGEERPVLIASWFPTFAFVCSPYAPFSWPLIFTRDIPSIRIFTFTIGAIVIPSRRLVITTSASIIIALSIVILIITPLIVSPLWRTTSTRWWGSCCGGWWGSCWWGSRIGFHIGLNPI